MALLKQTEAENMDNVGNIGYIYRSLLGFSYVSPSLTRWLSAW